MSIFTRRHYVWLASVARDVRGNAGQTTSDPRIAEAIDLYINTLADALESESIGFNRQRFIDAIYKDPTIDQMHTQDYETYSIRK